MTLHQQIEEAILSTLVVENKESIKAYCVPKLVEIVLEVAREAYDKGRIDQCNYECGRGNGSFKQFIQDYE